jgi:hypothetical protein
MAWFPKGETLPEMERNLIQLNITMLMAIWNSLRFYIVHILLKGQILDMPHYIKYIWSTIRELHPQSARHSLVIHANNARLDIGQKFKTFLSETLSEMPFILDIPWFDSVRFLSIRSCQVLSEGTFICSGRGISFGNSHNCEANLIAQLGGRVQEVDAESNLGRSTRGSLLCLK